MNISGFLKKTELKLIKKRKASGDKHVFHFESKDLVNWKAGQYGMFIFKGARLKGNNYRIFSIASSADEKDIIIWTNIVENPRELKEKILKMINSQDTNNCSNVNIDSKNSINITL